MQQKMQDTKLKQQEKFVFIDKYMFQWGQKLNEGAYGQVYKGYYRPEIGEKNEFIYPLAIKKQSLPDSLNEYDKLELVNSIRGDIITLKLLNHPNIVKLIDVKQMNSKSDKDIYIFMEFCKDGDLTQFMKGKEFSEIEICYFFSQILEAFKLIHACNLMHRDVKPQNIMVNDGVIKVGDFGFAKKFEINKQVEYKLQTFAIIELNDNNSENSFMFKINKQAEDSLIIFGFYGISSDHNIYESKFGGEIIKTKIPNQKNISLHEGVFCKLNMKEKVIIMHGNNEQGKPQVLEIDKIFNYGDLNGNNIGVFALVQSPQDEAMITLMNAPKLYKSFKGTTATVAPQVIEGYYSEKCDIYSLGATLYWMIYRKFHIYEEIRNEYKLLREMQKNQINFPQTPKISDELKSAIKQMMQYKESDRIDWEELFKLPIFNIKSIIENPLLNVIKIIDYDKIIYNNDDLDKITKEVEEEFDLYLPIVENEYNDQMQEEQALQFVREVENQIQKQNINGQMLTYLTFEKGKAQFIRMVYLNIKQFREYGYTIPGINENYVVLEDYLDLIIFGLSKYEMILLSKILTALNDTENGYKLKEAVFIIDDLFMVFSMDLIFKWNKQNPINFSNFFQSRRMAKNSENDFKQIFQRVGKSLNTFFPQVDH